MNEPGRVLFVNVCRKCATETFCFETNYCEKQGCELVRVKRGFDKNISKRMGDAIRTVENNEIDKIFNASMEA